MFQKKFSNRLKPTPTSRNKTGHQNIKKNDQKNLKVYPKTSLWKWVLKLYMSVI